MENATDNQSLQPQKTSSYKESGVDIEKNDNIVNLIKKRIPSIGLFGGFYDMSDLKNMKCPILVSSTDGVGTKTKIATTANEYIDISYDIVNHCVNDIIVHGAKPLYFLDYIGYNNLSEEAITSIVQHISFACSRNDCKLIGGEIAEMPSIFSENEFDIVGTIVGVVEKEEIIDGKSIQKGDVAIGLRSSGVHTNGFSLIFKIFKEFFHCFVMVDSNPELRMALQTPHRSYYKEFQDLKKNNIKIKGAAHITGGGIVGNLSRIMPDTLSAKINKNSWKRLGCHKVFETIQEKGISEEEMYKVFNMGIGMILIISKKDVKKTMNVLRDADIIGKIISRKKTLPPVYLV